MNCFLQFFPTPSLNVEQLQLQNPHIHIFQMIPVSLGMHHRGGVGTLVKVNEVFQTVPFLYRGIITNSASGLPMQLCPSITSVGLLPLPLTLDGAVWLSMKLFNLNDKSSLLVFCF